MKNVSKRILAVVLAMVLCLSLLPGIALAADSYKKVTGLSDVTAGGKFVLVAGGFAMDTTLQGNKKFNGIAVTPSGDTLSGSLPVWTFETVEGGIAISVDGQYLAYETSTNFMMQADPYTWTVEVGNGGFVIKSAASNKRGLFLQTSSSRFGAYSTTNTSGYVFDLELYKLDDGTTCDHDYDCTVISAVTCTKDGKESYTCTKCGDNYIKTLAATGHNYVKNVCANCGLAIATDPAKILPDAYALAEGESLEYDAILTGNVVSIDEAYSESYNNITVTIAVAGYEEMPVQCYRLKGTGIDTLAVGDEISVFGSIKNYKGTIEFNTGCTVVVVAPTDPAKIVEAAYALGEGEALPYEATLTGVVTEVGTYNETYGDINLSIEVLGQSFYCYALKGEGVKDLQVGDTITVTGTIKNYYGKVEFDKATMEKAEAPVQGATVSGVVVSGAEGDVTIELIAEGEIVATATAAGKEGTYSIEDVAAGTYTLKVSQLNHVAREYTITVESEDVAQDVKIHLIGDIDGNGKINMGDVSKLNAHLKGTNPITDEYMILCANVNGGKLNMGDTASLYSHIKGTKPLY